MTQLPENLRYALTHEWVTVSDETTIHVGITDFAQQQLGDLVYIGMPDIGRRVVAQEACATLESVKTASEIHSPVSGEIIAINTELQDSPELVNDDPYGTWIFSVKADDLAGLGQLVNAEGYQDSIS
ncbi:MAG: glycine cleavage system protein GcvH [Methylococcaceae bacterium]|nr:glycine cleavage system protein GcvH [Methylococcaceae bacterium]